jgi:hypothetical protein
MHRVPVILLNLPNDSPTLNGLYFEFDFHFTVSYGKQLNFNLTHQTGWKIVEWN